VSLKRRDPFSGREYIVENPNREERPFDTDSPHAELMVLAHIDWLMDSDCPLEAELMQLDWQMRIGTLAPGQEVRDRIRELKQYFQIQDRKPIHKTVKSARGRDQRITLFLEETLGQWYTKATVNLLQMEEFLQELHDYPITSLCLACNGTSAPALVAQYLNYKWLRKVYRLELNNFDVDYISLRQLFKTTVIQPRELLITGRPKRVPTMDQLEILPTLCPSLKGLWRIEYHGVKYDYRLPAEENAGAAKQGSGESAT
jgi:hypothetical protein